MNSNELIEYLRDPSSLSTENLRELETVISQAPYFQSARMLLAKGSQLLKEPTTKRRIASAAIYATDRPLLKKYISGKLLFLTKPPQKPDPASQGKRAPSKPTKASGSRAPKRVPRRRNPEPPVTPLKEDEMTVLGIPSGALDVMLNELEQDMEELKSSRSKFADIQQKLVDQDAVSEALEHASALKEEFQKELDEEERAKQNPETKESEQQSAAKPEVTQVETKKKSEEEKIEAKEIIASVIDDIQEEEQNDVTQNKETEASVHEEQVEPPKEKVVPETKEDKPEEDPLPSKTRSISNTGTLSTGLSNTSEEALKNLEASMWGDDDTRTEEKPDTQTSAKKKSASGTKNASSPRTSSKATTKSSPATKTSAKKTPAKKPAAKKSGTTSTAKKKTTPDKKDDDDGKGDRKKSQQQIIDKFIKENPSIPRLEEPLSPTEDLSDDCGEWSDDLVSENLAEIYLKQGNKKRALEIYETLSLKFPEKKSYFADLISKIN